MVKRKIIWSDYAKKGFVEILEYYFIRNGNKKYSTKFRNQIKSAIDLLMTQPFLGKKSDFENVRCLVESNYLIFYSPEEESIEIKLIWDSRRNPEDIKFE